MPSKTKLESWEVTQYALAGITRLCGRCKKRPLDIDDPKYTGRQRLSRHCLQCWKNKCIQVFDKGGVCTHTSPYYLSFPHSR